VKVGDHTRPRVCPSAPSRKGWHSGRVTSVLITHVTCGRRIPPAKAPEDAREGACARAPSSGTPPLGERPSTTETMKTDDNRIATASPRGGVESSVVGTPSTATKVNTIRRQTWTSLRASGEVQAEEQSKADTHEPSHGGSCVASGVVGGSRWGRGCVREDGRTAGAGSRKRLPAEVRTAIRAEKRGNARGAKGGREVNRPRP
jgi:hypothetical protein